MKILLDTNIIIHREANKIMNNNIGVLFNWIDKLKYTKCVHPLTYLEIDKNPNKETVKTMQVKLDNYYILKTQAPLYEKIRSISKAIDTNENDINDSALLNELYNNRVDILITEDKKIHKKAEQLELSNRVYFIDEFLEKISTDHPELIDYKILSVKREYFGNVNLSDAFFDSFREDYIGFDSWFNRKSDEIAYVCYNEGKIAAFLYLKVEGEQELYNDITPTLLANKRLKIGTLKVSSTGYKIGERFLKIVFDNAIQNKVTEVYVTIFNNRSEQQRLIQLLQDFGFTFHGIKETSSGREDVYIRQLWPSVNSEIPRLTFPRLSKDTKSFIIPVKPEYHTELFPDSILNTESKFDFIENEPHRNAISKVYVSHSSTRNLNNGDKIVFYRSGGIYKGVVTTIGIVENVVNNVSSLDELKQICRKRTVLDEEELSKYWNRYVNIKPFVINFLYAFSLKKRITLKELLDSGLLPSMDFVKTITEIDNDNLSKIIKRGGI